MQECVDKNYENGYSFSVLLHTRQFDVKESPMGNKNKQKKNSTVAEEKKPSTFPVNADAPARMNRGLTLAKHSRLGTLTLEPRDGKLFVNGRELTLVSCTEANGAMMTAEAAMKATEARRPLNSTVRDFLAENVKLIPKDWKGKSIFFPGTVFSTPSGDPCIPFIYEMCGWSWHNLPLDGGAQKNVFGKNAFIAVLS